MKQKRSNLSVTKNGRVRFFVWISPLISLQTLFLTADSMAVSD